MHAQSRVWGCWMAAMMLVAAPLGAQTSAEKKAAAEALFDEGRRLLDAGDTARACEKFEDSDRLDPAVGTQLNLATCYQRAGRTASAWAMFRRAAASARERGQAEREQLARSQADALEGSLARLTIDVPAAARIEGLVISKNGAPLERAMWGQPVPVDPGTISIEASAPGHRKWQGTLEIRQAGQTQSVTIPVLATDPNAQPEPPEEPAAKPPPVSVVSAPPAAPDAGESGGSQRTWGLIVGGAGVVGLAVGGLFALQAKSKYDDSKASCLPNDVNRCTSEGVALRDDARTAGNVASVTGGLGLALVATGAVLFLTAPSKPATARLAIATTPGGASLALGGAF